MKKKPHFKATITYFKTDEGGIVTPVSTGFRSTVKFPYDNADYLAHQTFLEQEIVFPGDTTSAEITLLDGKERLEKLYKGLGFDLLISSDLIATGVITDIL